MGLLGYRITRLLLLAACSATALAAQDARPSPRSEAAVADDTWLALPDAPTPQTADVAPPMLAVPVAAAVPPFPLFTPESDLLAAVAQPVTGTAAKVPLRQCPYDRTHARECAMHWHDLMIGAGAYLAFQDVGNLYSGYTYRYQTSHGKWFDRWINSSAGWRWTRWSDGNPWLDDYVGHSLMGAITNAIWIENDPSGMTVEQGNTPEYRRRLWRAFLFSAAFSFQWKLGPLGEASIGHNGDYYQDENGLPATNETGWVELVTTPVGGALWTVGEDALDERVIARWEQRHSNPLLLIGYSFLTPAHATANVFRFRAPWYRDTRVVHASGLFQRRDPAELAEEGALGARRRPEAQPTAGEPFQFGGKYEFGALLGVSLTHDTAFGSDENNKYMDIIVRGSTRLTQNNTVAVRYSPEVIAAAMLDEPLPKATDPKLLRTRTYGAGINPEGFQVVFTPTSRVQPYLEQHLGVIEFFKPVLLATRPGSNAVYDASFGAGMNVVRKNGAAISYGYRFQHLAPIRGSQSNATDAHSFYIAVSRFFQRRSDVY